MAPVPKDSKDKPKDSNTGSDSDADPFHNPNILPVQGGDSESDSDDEYGGDMIAPGGYSLLPSEPGANQEDSDSDSEADEDNDCAALERGMGAEAEGATAACGMECLDETGSGGLSDEHRRTGPKTDDVSNPAATEKYPQGKIPSYLHVPKIPKDKNAVLWNERRAEKKQVLDKGQESAILKAMSGFRLPPESIPAWAQNIPDEQWHNQIQSRIKGRTDTGKGTTQQDANNKNSSPESSTSTTDHQEHWVAEFPE